MRKDKGRRDLAVREEATLELGNGGMRNGNGTRQRLTWVIREIESILNTLHQCLIFLLKTGEVMNMLDLFFAPLFHLFV